MVKFNFCDRFVSSYTVAARKSLVWRCSGWVIIYCYDMMSFLIVSLFKRPCISLFPNWMGRRKLPATYLATDSLQLGCSCKRVFLADMFEKKRESQANKNGTNEWVKQVFVHELQSLKRNQLHTKGVSVATSSATKIGRVFFWILIF